MSADFSLRRGSERGRFELVIAVVETKPVFIGGALGLAAFGERDSRGHSPSLSSAPE